MSLHQMNVDWKQIQTYATEKNLVKRINQDKELYPEHHDRFMVVQTPEGRWTAIVVLDRSKGGYLGRYSSFLKV